MNLFCFGNCVVADCSVITVFRICNVCDKLRCVCYIWHCWLLCQFAWYWVDIVESMIYLFIYPYMSMQLC